jgi:hypothetical protein
MPYAREVDKDVNPIVADQLDQCFISQPLGFALVIRVCACAGYYCTNICKRAPVSAVQNGFKEVRHRVRPKITGDESDPHWFRLTRGVQQAKSTPGAPGKSAIPI